MLYLFCLPCSACGPSNFGQTPVTCFPSGFPDSGFLIIPSAWREKRGSLCSSRVYPAITQGNLRATLNGGCAQGNEVCPNRAATEHDEVDLYLLTRKRPEGRRQTTEWDLHIRREMPE